MFGDVITTIILTSLHQLDFMYTVYLSNWVLTTSVEHDHFPLKKNQNITFIQVL